MYNISTLRFGSRYVVYRNIVENIVTGISPTSYSFEDVRGQSDVFLIEDENLIETLDTVIEAIHIRNQLTEALLGTL